MTSRRPSDLLVVGNLHTCYVASRICSLSFVTESVGKFNH